MERFKKQKNIILIILFFIALILSSEAIYWSKNYALLTRFYLEQARIAASKSEPKKSLAYLLKAAKIEIKKTSKKYSTLIPKTPSYDFKLNENNQGFSEAFIFYLSGLHPFTIKGDQFHLAKIFYELGLLAFQQDMESLVPKFFLTAIFLDPELSHYHVELANFYLRGGDIEKTKDTLSFCQKFTYPKTHCQQYIDNNLYWNVPEEIGFLKNVVEQHYASETSY